MRILNDDSQADVLSVQRKLPEESDISEPSNDKAFEKDGKAINKTEKGGWNFYTAQ
jgi:hypothetical protein